MVANRRAWVKFVTSLSHLLLSERFGKRDSSSMAHVCFGRVGPDRNARPKAFGVLRYTMIHRND